MTAVLNSYTPDATLRFDVNSASDCADACKMEWAACDTFIYNYVCSLYKEAVLKQGIGKSLRGSFGGWCPPKGESSVT